MNFKIESIWAFISIADDGDEGVCGFQSNGTWIPMIGADIFRVDQLKPIAKQLATVSGQTIKLIHFTGEREELETYIPGKE